MIKLNEGRIGRQESVSIVGLALYTSMTFTVDSQMAYAKGNSAYLWEPLSIAVAFFIFWIVCYAMKKSGSERLGGLITDSLGNVAGGAVRVIISFYLLYSAFMLLAKFSAMIHGFIYRDAQSPLVIAWLIPAVAVIAVWGLECIGRVAKCLASLLAVLLLLGFLGPAGDFKLYRIYPLIGDGVKSAVMNIGVNQIRALPPFIALLAVTKGVQGIDNAKKYGVIAACISGGLVLITQLVLALTYTYKELSNMFVPLYRQNMTLLQEGYFFRLDKIALFLWLTGCIVTAAFYIYAASILLCGKRTIRDIRPLALSCVISIFCVILLSGTEKTSMIDVVLLWIEQYGFIGIIALAIGIAGAALIKYGKKGELQGEKSA